MTGVTDTGAGDLAAGARAELLERLAHFGVAPRTVLDLGSGVTGADAAARGALRKALPRARIIATTGPERAEAAAAAAPGAATRALDALRRLLQGAAPRIERLTAPPDRLPLADGSVDLVLGHWLAPGSAALDAVLAEVRRVLAPHGLFLWTTPGLGAPGTEPLDMHDLGGALARAGFVEPVLDVDRHRGPGDGAVVEVIHAAAFAGDARGKARVGTDETLVPLRSIGRRRGTAHDPGDDRP